jgi:DNA-directed RNA polymerase subunit RPC12/RpoP
LAILGLGIFSICYFIFIYSWNKKRKEKEKAKITAEAVKAAKELIEAEKIKTMSFSDFLRENEMEQYCEVFETNKIHDMATAISLTDADLTSIGISILGDRKKILTLIETKKSSLAGTAGTDGIKCPNCGSKNVQAVSEVTGDSKGFGCCKGGLGAILFGPIGFLCGLCGMGKGKTTTNLLWVCGNCGHKFK